MRRKRGFALLDIVVALFVIVVLLLSCCSLFIGSLRLSQQSQIQAAAYEAAKQELEILKSYKYGNRLATSSTAFTIPSTITSQFPNQQMTGTYSVSTYGTYTDPPMQQIVVVVTWKRLGVYKPVTSYVQLDTLQSEEPNQ